MIFSDTVHKYTSTRLPMMQLYKSCTLLYFTGYRQGSVLVSLGYVVSIHLQVKLFTVSESHLLLIIVAMFLKIVYLFNLIIL